LKEFMMGTLNQSAGVPASLSASTEAPCDPAPATATAVRNVTATSGADLLDLDALTQQYTGEISVLVTAAIAALALEAAALVVVRQLLLLIQDRAQELADAVNSTAEEHGCNYIDEAERAFAAKLQRSAA
jgi:hypothetical protein